MAVYVGELYSCEQTRWWKWDKACCLFADTRQELLAFSDKLGMKPDWFQSNPKFPHFVLTENKRKQAIQMGAQAVSKEIEKFVRNRLYDEWCASMKG